MQSITFSRQCLGVLKVDYMWVKEESVGGRGTNLLPENASFRSKACWREFFGKFNWAVASPSPCVYWAVKFARLTKPMV